MKVHSFALHAKEDLRPIEWDIPEIEPGGVLFRVIACGICGSIVHVLRRCPATPCRSSWAMSSQGRWFQVRANAWKRFKPGDVAAVAPLIPCMSCRPCSHGQDNL